MTTPLLEATLASISEADNEIGGLRLTRLTAAVSVGATTFPVESTLDWPDAGTVGVGGVQYHYTSRSIFALVGITYKDAGADIAGAALDHTVETPVIDKSRTYSGIDQVRAAIMVDTAEGADLSVVGRNVGVLRLPFVAEDDTYRAIIKALAYNPRGTIYGMELALDAMVGAGNYEIIEDLMIDNNTVKIRLLTDGVNATFQGKAFLPSTDCSGLTGLDLALTEVPLAIGGVRLYPESHITETVTQKPSSEAFDECTGIAADTWAYTGPSEAADVILTAGSYIEMTDGSAANVCRYQREIRCTSDGEWGASMIMSVPSGTTLGGAAADHVQWGAGVYETTGIETSDHYVAWGVVGVTGSTYSVGFATSGGYTAAVTLNMGQFYEITMRRRGDRADLLVDGSIVATALASAFPAGGGASGGQFSFGSFSTTLTGHKARVKQVGWYTRVPVDYWAVREDGDVVTASPRLLTSTHTPVGSSPYDFQTGDVGKQIRVTKGVALNGSGGTNNGVFEIESVDADDEVTLIGQALSDGLVSGAGDLFQSASDIRRFTYPRDLGKTLVITSGANAGSYTVDAILEEGTLLDLSTLSSPGEVQSGLAQLVDYGTANPATLLVGVGIDWRLDPEFVTEASVLSWELSDAGSFAGTTATFRVAPPVGADQELFEIIFSSVLSGQVLLDELVQNLLLSEDPLAFSFYPFYISDPLGFVRAYLDDVTVAGVIPEYLD